MIPIVWKNSTWDFIGWEIMGERTFLNGNLHEETSNVHILQLLWENI
jgi:hypothetical protein